MSLVKPPPTSWGIRIISILGALIVAALLLRLVLTFGWYASGLAALKEDERRRRETPIRLDFKDPNSLPDPNAARDANAPAEYRPRPFEPKDPNAARNPGAPRDPNAPASSN